MSPALQNADATTAEMEVVWMLAHVSLVMPAALAFGSPRSAHLDQRELVLMAGEHFSPGLSPQL